MARDNYLTDYVPHISKSEFDNEATKFLTAYCPEALQHPMAIPIEEIAKKKLGLRIIEERLSEDFSILGQMCFTTGRAEIYDLDNDEYREIVVRGGTMIVDPDNVLKRNIGSKRNTMSHECVHWTKHRDYYILANQTSASMAIACRCPTEEKDEAFNQQWNDEDWMEWQANGIAPRILMPKETVPIIFNNLLEDSENNPFIASNLISKTKWIIEQLAGFYQVSKQSAEIRLHELGLLA